MDRLPRRRPGRSTTSDLDRARKASSRVASPVWVVTNLVALGASPTGDDRRARFSDASLCGGNSHGALGVEKGSTSDFALTIDGEPCPLSQKDSDAYWEWDQLVRAGASASTSSSSGR